MTQQIGRNDPCQCGSGKKYKKCGLLYSPEHKALMPRPQPEHEPITEGVFGQSTGYFRGTSELYLPYRFRNLSCKVLKFTSDLKNLRQMVLNIQFVLEGDQKDIDSLYEEEYWKQRSTENLLRYIKPDFRAGPTFAPVFCIMLNRFLKVEKVELMIDSEKAHALFDLTPDILILPESYPPLTNLPQTENYIYYDKKSTAIYTELQLGVIYNLTIELESAAAAFEFAPLFPFGKVDYSNVDIQGRSSGDLETQVACMKVSPEINKFYPDWLEYSLHRDISAFTPPRILPAHAYRGSFPLFHLEKDMGITEQDIATNQDAYVLKLNNIKGQIITDYSTYRFMSGIIIPQDKDLDIIVKVINRPLPTRIYDQLQTLPGYNDVLVEYDVINTTHEKRELIIETDIIGLTDKAIDSLQVLGLDNEEKKPARAKLRHCPILKHGSLESIVNPSKATLHCKVTDKKTGQLFFEQSYVIDILPHDQMIWEIRDVGNSRTHTLVDFIAAWVHPTDKEGSIDKARAGSIKYHPDGAMGHDINTLEGVRKHVQAVWEHLSKDYQIKYLSQPFTTKNISDSQRVVLPEKVLQNKAGNCIDLVVLFASILEGMGISSLIFLTEDHAFIGWGNPNTTKQMFFLETTVIGNVDFDDAVKIGEEKFRSNFLLKGMDNPMPDLMATTTGRHIVDLSEARRAGIISKR